MASLYRSRVRLAQALGIGRSRLLLRVQPTHLALYVCAYPTALQPRFAPRITRRLDDFVRAACRVLEDHDRAYLMVGWKHFGGYDVDTDDPDAVDLIALC